MLSGLGVLLFRALYVIFPFAGAANDEDFFSAYEGVNSAWYPNATGGGQRVPSSLGWLGSGLRVGVNVETRGTLVRIIPGIYWRNRGVGELSISRAVVSDSNGQWLYLADGARNSVILRIGDEELLARILALPSSE